MVLYVNCSHCGAQSQAPPGASAIQCSRCHTVTRVATNHARPLPPPQSRANGPPAAGRKKAVIIGLNYKNTRTALDGCINDANRMKKFLINRFKFPTSGIHLLTEEEKDPNMIPTKRNIRRAMSWLVAGVRAGDSLVFYYSGHGSQVEDQDGDELDKLSETICPLDHILNGEIADDEINNTIVKPIPRGAKLTAIIDACHSGTVLDLPYLCTMKRNGKYGWESHHARPGKWKGTNGGEAFCFSGCDDTQLSLETKVKVIPTGAMTTYFIQAIERGHAGTYGSLLNAIRDSIRNAAADDEDATENDGDGDGDGDDEVEEMQEPQLSTNQQFEIYKKPFSL